MLILAVRTGKPEAEIYLLQDSKIVAEEKWQAHRALAVTLHKKIDELLTSVNQKLDDLEGVVYFSGPGSFTGLRIGASVVNAMADSLNIPAAQAGGENWIEEAVQRLGGSHYVSPEYGSNAHITTPKK